MFQNCSLKALRRIPSPVMLGLLMLSGCAQRQGLEAERQALIAADLEFARITAQEGAKGWASFFAEDGVMLPNGAPDVVGKPSILEAMTLAFSQPGYMLKWQPNEAHVSASGDLGYTVGSYTATGQGRDGQVVRSVGRYVSIWKKDKLGAWKVALDIGNETAPPNSSPTQ